MAGLLYFASEAATPALKEHLKSLGMANPIKRGCENGPGAADGGIFARDLDHGKVGYFPSTQTWIKAPGADWFIGWHNDSPPMPADLQRAELLPGHAVTLDDGNAWTIPIVRLVTGDIGLPQRLGLDDNGQVVKKPLDRYAELTAIAEELWTLLQGQQEAAASSLEIDWDYGIKALATNYYLSGQEISALGLFTEKKLGEAVLALVDFPTLKLLVKELAETQKKKPNLSASSSIDSGVTASPQPIDPALPTSTSTEEGTEHG